jgi:predicted Mrr-cat superfamily restriction endonuclease
MPMRPEELAALMHEVEQEDPIDFADLPFAEEELRQLVAAHLCEMASAMENFSTEDRLTTLLAVSAKLVLENLVLNVQLLRRHGLPVSESVDGLLSRLRKGDGPDQA